MTPQNFIKTFFNYCGVYTAGVLISTAFVLSVNDMFYNVAFRQLIRDRNKDAWQEIKPREIFSRGAKFTFIKHPIEEERDDDAKRYSSYIEKRKVMNEGGVDNDKKLYENIFDKKTSSNDKL